jgi:hypothetical protein
MHSLEPDTCGIWSTSSASLRSFSVTQFVEEATGTVADCFVDFNRSRGVKMNINFHLGPRFRILGAVLLSRILLHDLIKYRNAFSFTLFI